MLLGLQSIPYYRSVLADFFPLIWGTGISRPCIRRSNQVAVWSVTRMQRPTCSFIVHNYSYKQSVKRCIINFQYPHIGKLTANNHWCIASGNKEGICRIRTSTRAERLKLSFIKVTSSLQIELWFVIMEWIVAGAANCSNLPRSNLSCWIKYQLIV